MRLSARPAAYAGYRCRCQVDGMPPSGWSSFDHLVGAGDECRRYFEAERPRRLSVEDQNELCRLLDRQVGGFGALENPVDEIRPAVKDVGKIHPVPDQPTG